MQTYEKGTMVSGLAMFDDGTWKEVRSETPRLMSEMEVSNWLQRMQSGKCFAIVLIRAE